MNSILFWRRFDAHTWLIARLVIGGMMFGFCLGCFILDESIADLWVVLLTFSMLVLSEAAYLAHSDTKKREASEMSRAHTEAGEIVIHNDGTWSWAQ